MIFEKEKSKKLSFSILGDSISTLAGWNPPGNAVFYDLQKRMSAGVYLSDDTWWGQVIAAFDGELLINDAWSGSMVCKHPLCEIPSYACGDFRTSRLGSEGKNPDLILIEMGTNDWGAGMRTTTNYVKSSDLSCFPIAYRLMLEKIKANYPAALLVCMTPARTICSRESAFVFSDAPGGRCLNEYCDAILTMAQEMGCLAIDLSKLEYPCDTIDGFHPNAKGMQTIANAVIGELRKVINKEEDR